MDHVVTVKHLCCTHLVFQTVSADDSQTPATPSSKHGPDWPWDMGLIASAGTVNGQVHTNGSRSVQAKTFTRQVADCWLELKQRMKPSLKLQSPLLTIELSNTDEDMPILNCAHTCSQEVVTDGSIEPCKAVNLADGHSHTSPQCSA